MHILSDKKQDVLALDRAAVQESVRAKDEDGHLHVSATPITKANVCPYRGSEIPNWQRLGLDADRIYHLYRDPAELEKAVGTFNGKPLLLGHRIVSAEDHDHVSTVGGTTNTFWQAPYIMAALDVWSGPAIKGIEDEEVAELSAAYRYEADMRPGTTPEGVRFDGRMIGISGNHVALVPRGRAGRDVVVRDHALWAFSRNPQMNKAKLSPAAAQTRGALAVYTKPKLAQDAVIDFDPILSGVTAKNFKATIPAMVLGLQRAVKGKLAADADIEDVAEVIEALAEILPPETEAEVKQAVEGAEGGEVTDDADDTELRAMLKAKGLSDEEIDRICAMTCAGGAVDEGKGGDVVKAMDAAIKAAVTASKKGMVPQAAMDAAIATAKAEAKAEAIAATTAHLNGIADAKRFVGPYVGEIAIACDSEEAVYRQALTMLGKAHAGKHADALRDIIESCPKAGEQRHAAPRLAQDAEGAKTFSDRFGTGRIGFAA